MNSLRLTALLVSAALALAGCGRKNLPVAPGAAATPVGTEADPGTNSPSSVRNFQRAARLSSPGTDLTVSPAEVSSNPDSQRKSFPLDFLLN